MLCCPPFYFIGPLSLTHTITVSVCVPFPPIIFILIFLFLCKSTQFPITKKINLSTGDMTGKGKNIMFNEIEDSGVDELLAVLGYRVKPSDMDDVAQKIEHLEGVFGSGDGNYSQIVSDSNHLNPSCLNSWLESMISEVNGTGNGNSNGNEIENVYTDDLQAIVYPPNKKVKLNPNNPNPNPNDLNQNNPNMNNPNQVVLVDSQENGIRLVHTLMACAEAIQNEKFSLAENLVKQSGILAVSQVGAMRKVATYFAEGLARRIYGLSPVNSDDSPGFLDMLQMHFYETCPYLKFAHFTANQAILEAVNGKTKVHVIDFGMKQGMQWPALMQALALRAGGPPSFRLTGIGPPAGDDTDYLQQVGWKLAQFAETIHVEFEFRGFVAGSLADLEPEMFNLRDGEVVAVNSVFELHRLLARPGSVEKVLSTVRQIKPVVFTVGEQEANHNGSVFLNRFNESLHYYSTLFDSLETSGSGAGVGTGTDVSSDQNKIMSEIYLGKQICNVVACEGVDRVERHETTTQWKTRLDSGGFEPVHLGSNAFKQASMLLEVFAGSNGYRVEENDGCLMLCWHTRPLITTSAWKIR